MIFIRQINIIVFLELEKLPTDSTCEVSVGNKGYIISSFLLSPLCCRCLVPIHPNSILRLGRTGQKPNSRQLCKKIRIRVFTPCRTASHVSKWGAITKRITVFTLSRPLFYDNHYFIPVGRRKIIDFFHDLLSLRVCVAGKSATPNLNPIPDPFLTVPFTLALLVSKLPPVMSEIGQTLCCSAAW